MRGISVSSSMLCVGGCGGAETEEHIFFKCPTLSVVWREIVNWLGIPIVLEKGGYDHLIVLNNLVHGKAKVKEILAIISYSTVYSIWKARNAMVFNQSSYDWENVVDDIKISSWRILINPAKGFMFNFSEWNLSPLPCMRLMGGGI
jgi:hypothetical protein